MARHSNDQTLKEAVDGLLKAFNLEDKLKQVKLIDSWEKIMGPSVANRTTDLKISGKKLYVTLNSASLREELFREREKVLQLLNDNAGSVVIEEIVFN